MSDDTGLGLSKHWDKVRGRVTLLVRNGAAVQGAVTVEDSYPASVAGVLCFARSRGAAPAASAAGGKITWRLAGLKPGEVRELVYTALSPAALNDPASPKVPSERDYALLEASKDLPPRLIAEAGAPEPAGKTPPPAMQPIQPAPEQRSVHAVSREQPAEAVSGRQPAEAVSGQQPAQAVSAKPRGPAIPGRQPSRPVPEQKDAPPVPGQQPAQAVPEQQSTQAVPVPQPEHAIPGRQTATTGRKKGECKAIAVGAGKGGTGKTTFSINLAVALAELGFDTVLLDADASMGNLGPYMGIDLESMKATLHEVLAGEAEPEKAVYRAFSERLRVVPSGLSIAGFLRMDRGLLADVIGHFSAGADYVVIDTPAGYNKEVAMALKAADDLLLVLNPDEGSLIDGLKVQEMARILGVNVPGIVLNRYDMKGHKYSKAQIEAHFGSPVLAMLPEDPNVRRQDRLPVVLASPGSRAAQEIMKVARLISRRTNEPVQAPRPFATRLMEALFRA